MHFLPRFPFIFCRLECYWTDCSFMLPVSSLVLCKLRQYNFLSCFKVLMKQTVCTNQQPVMKYRPIRCNPGNVFGVQTKKVKISSNSSIRADCLLASELLRLWLVLSSLALFASCKPTDVSGQWFLGMWSQICLCKWSRPFLCLKTNKQKNRSVM